MSRKKSTGIKPLMPTFGASKIAEANSPGTSVPGKRDKYLRTSEFDAA
jgi:hypothetical protein